jgi:hypothetical protein
VRAIASGALALAVCAGCILVVSPEPGGEHCQFHGRDTPCGACLAARCQTEIDGACFDEAVLAPVEQCARLGDDACDRLPPSPVTACLRERCPSLCYRREGTSTTRCGESFVGQGLACSCDIGAPPNDYVCSSAVFARTRCCAPNGWPGPALLCTCNAIECQPTTDGCVCILSDNVEPVTAQECRGAHCCAVDDRCQCRTRACAGAEREVPVCNKAELACPRGTKAVDACSIRQ